MEIRYRTYDPLKIGRPADRLAGRRGTARGAVRHGAVQCGTVRREEMNSRSELKLVTKLIHPRVLEHLRTGGEFA